MTDIEQPLRSVRIQKFGAISDARLDLVRGVNVVLGVNGTGKTHLLKLVYSALRALEHDDPNIPPAARLSGKLARVFRPDDGDVRRLVRRRPKRSRARIDLSLSGGRSVRFAIGQGKTPLRIESGGEDALEVPATFLPSREMLAMYEGFVDDYERRELSFDETYYDTALALRTPALRGQLPRHLRTIAHDFEDELGGSVRLEGPRFYVKGPSGALEAHLLAEGHRKIATIRHLIANGTLREQAVLLWDEPEANLHPALIERVVDGLGELALGGVQVVLATHDDLVAQRISSWAEFPHGSGPRPDVRFFQLVKTEPGVTAKAAETFAQLDPNPIADAYERQAEKQLDLAVNAARTTSRRAGR